MAAVKSLHVQQTKFEASLGIAILKGSPNLTAYIHTVSGMTTHFSRKLEAKSIASTNSATLAYRLIIFDSIARRSCLLFPITDNGGPGKIRTYDAV